jgi:hypothetical protein
LAASVTSTISARRTPTLSVALNVSDSSPARVSGARRPTSSVGPVRPGAVLSVIVMREPYNSTNAVPGVPLPSLPKEHALPSPVQHPAESVMDGAFAAAVARGELARVTAITGVWAAPDELLPRYPYQCPSAASASWSDCW